ncbi:CapA family protein [Emcibacter sp.]|uniref:CapA family protein n=1 Tax=Emcibacter sp. TaxID=1979954 RepID=UPI003A8E5A88
MIDYFVNHSKKDKATSLVFTGDMVLDVEDSAHWLSGIADALAVSDLNIVHIEVPHTACSEEMEGDIPAPGADPENLNPLSALGKTVATLAGNHIADCGMQGIMDTRSKLADLGILSTGAGRDIGQAREPVTIEVDGRRIAVIAYNCVGPELSWAGKNKAGCAYLPMSTLSGEPVSPTVELSAVSEEALSILREDIGQVRRKADLVIVALHKGIVHTPAVLAAYERPVAHAAVEAGADIVIGHHAHIVRGIEFHNGKPVFHGLGNGCVVTRALSPNATHPKRAEWARRRKELFGFEPDPRYELAPFHPEAVNAFLGCVVWHRDGRLETGIIPLYVEPPGRPVIANREMSERICAYLKDITVRAGLPMINLEYREGVVFIS